MDELDTSRRNKVAKPASSKDSTPTTSEYPEGEPALSEDLGILTRNSSIEAQAIRLGDERLGRAQRQMLASQIGHIGGNQHLHRLLQMKRRADSAAAIEPSSARKIQTKRNRDLPEDVQAKMEHAFGEDFSDVTIKEDSRDAAQLQARAFTQGNSIHFAPDTFSPSSPEGETVLAHELAHVVQQRNGAVTGTHAENGYSVSDQATLEAEAHAEGQRAVRGEPTRTRSASTARDAGTTPSYQAVQPIQMWRDVPGQVQIESTAPNTARAWEIFMQAAHQSVGGHADSAEPELRSLYYGLISDMMRGSFRPISIDAHTTSGFNHHWTGSVRFVFGDSETPLAGSGTGSTTLGDTSSSSGTLTTSSSSTTGSSGGAQVSQTPGQGGGTGGQANASGNGSTTTGVSNAQGTSQSTGSTSSVTQNLQRFTSQIGIEVNLTAEYDMGSSWTDWINPATYGAWGMNSLTGKNGSATGECGTATYYRGAGIAGPPPSH